MNAVTQQIDRQADERFRKAGETDSHDVRDESQIHDHRVRNEARGAQIVQVGVTEKSLLLMVILPIILVSILAILALMYSHTAETDARRAWDRADIAEREARVAQDKLQHYEILLVEKGVIDAGEVH